MPKRARIKPGPKPGQGLPDYVEAGLARLRAHKLVAVVVIAVAVLAGAATFTDSLLKLRSAWDRLWPNHALSFSFGLYVYEVANDASGGGRTLFEEVRHLTSRCSIYKTLNLATPDGPSLAPGTGGARANVLLKILLRNTSGGKLTSIKLLLAPMQYPIEFSELATSPNISALMSRPTIAQNGTSPYLITIESLMADDFAVLTLSSPLSRETAPRLFATNFPITVVSLLAEQITTAKALVAVEVRHPKDLFFEEGRKTTGHPGTSVSTKVNVLNRNERPKTEDFSFLPPSKECPE